MHSTGWRGHLRLLGAACAIVSSPLLSAGEPRAAPRSYDIEVFEPERIEEAARSGRTAVLHYFGGSHEVLLEPSRMRGRSFEPRGGAAAAASLGLEPARTFKGRLADEPGSIVRLSILPGGIRGFIKSSDGWAFIEPLRGERAAAGVDVEYVEGPLQHKVFTDGDLDIDFEALCEEPAIIDEALPDPTEAGSRAEARSLPAPPAGADDDLRVLEVAVDADVEFFAIHGANATAEIESVLNMVDGIYEAELGLSIQIAAVRIWTEEPDPYESLSASTLLSELRAHWNSQGQATSRDAVHLFTGKDLDGSTVGMAYVSVVCNESAAYGLSEDLGSDVIMPILVAHEIGHNLGANHDAAGSTPRYIMYPSIGSSNLDEFSPLSKSDISRYMDGVSCLALASGEAPPRRGGGGGGGGPVDPLLAAVLGAAALIRASRSRQARSRGRNGR